MAGDPAREVGYQEERRKERQLLIEKLNISLRAIYLGFYREARRELLEIRHRLDH